MVWFVVCGSLLQFVVPPPHHFAKNMSIPRFGLLNLNCEFVFCFTREKIPLCNFCHLAKDSLDIESYKKSLRRSHSSLWKNLTTYYFQDIQNKQLKLKKNPFELRERESHSGAPREYYGTYSNPSANMISYNISHNMMFQFGSKRFL